MSPCIYFIKKSKNTWPKIMVILKISNFFYSFKDFLSKNRRYFDFRFFSIIELLIEFTLEPLGWKSWIVANNFQELAGKNRRFLREFLVRSSCRKVIHLLNLGFFPHRQFLLESTDQNYGILRRTLLGQN